MARVRAVARRRRGRRVTTWAERIGVGGQHSWLEDTLRQQIALARTVPEPVLQHRFAKDESPPRQWRFDLAWPDVRVAVELQGGIWTRGKHSRGLGQERDAEKLSTAAAMGWRVLIVTDRFVKNGQALRWIERALGASTPPCPTT